jgi:hypothetical protein
VEKRRFNSPILQNGEMEKWRNGEILWHKNNNNVKIEDAVRAE